MGIETKADFAGISIIVTLQFCPILVLAVGDLHNIF